MGHSKWKKYVLAVEGYDTKIKEYKRALGRSFFGRPSKRRRIVQSYGQDTLRRIIAEETVQNLERASNFKKGRLNAPIPPTDEPGSLEMDI